MNSLRIQAIAVLRCGAWIASLCIGCSGAPETKGGQSASANTTIETAVPVAIARPPLEHDPNPLGLSVAAAAQEDVAPGQQVFTVPYAMLRGAKLGSSLTLRVATVVGREGDNYLIEGRDTPAYKVHSAYAIVVPGNVRPKLQQPVVAEWAGQLRHGVVKRYVRDDIVVRFIDSVDRAERTLKRPALIAQQDGFRPGNYVVHEEGADYRHYLLVSRVAGGTGRWFALGYAGTATLLEENKLSAVPVSYEPKVGTPVWAEWLGRMRPAVVRAVDRPGVFTVRFERVGKAIDVGWGFVMPPARTDLKK